MRVIAGSAKGMKLQTKKGSHTRPTTDKVKEAIFSMIQFELHDALVWDAFAGSGALGIEALSRGARAVDFTEIDKESQKWIKINLTNGNFAKDCYNIINKSALGYLNQSKKKYDLVFLDPPYNHALLQPLLDVLADRMNENALLVIEHDGGEKFLPNQVDFFLEKEKVYGKIRINIYRRNYAHSDLSREL